MQSPIIGVRTLEQLQDCLAAVDVTLTPAHLQRLDKVSAIDLGFPQKWGAGETGAALSFINGGCNVAAGRWDYA